jgi:hypothetical protein
MSFRLRTDRFVNGSVFLWGPLGLSLKDFFLHRLRFTILKGIFKKFPLGLSSFVGVGWPGAAGCVDEITFIGDKV